jgi:hypothetical protein
MIDQGKAPARQAPGQGRNETNCGISSTSQRTSQGELPQFIRDMLSAPPKSGDGMHPWLFKVARQLHAHRDFETIVSLLAVASEGCGRNVREKEIRDAAASAAECAWEPSGASRAVITPAAPKWPACDPAARKTAIESAGYNLADLWHASPVPCTRDSTDAEFFADQLFPGNPLICVGRSMSTFCTAHREDFRGTLSGMSLVVPSPMSALTGARKSDGKQSPHTLDNTGPRRFLVVEFDHGTADEQAALHWHLREYAPLVLVVSSGGKSQHGWYACEGIAEDVTRRFMRYAVTLGADPATWTRSQFVRLPQGWRADKQAPQDVAYFDPAKLERGDA